MAYVMQCFDEAGQRLPPEVIEAEDDQMAIALVRLRLPKRCELWDGDRLVYTKPERITSEPQEFVG